MIFYNVTLNELFIDELIIDYPDADTFYLEKAYKELGWIYIGDL